MRAPLRRREFMGASTKHHVKGCGRRSVMVNISPHLPNVVWAKRAMPSDWEDAIPARGPAKRACAGPDTPDPNGDAWRLVRRWQKVGGIAALFSLALRENVSTLSPSPSGRGQGEGEFRPLCGNLGYLFDTNPLDAQSNFVKVYNLKNGGCLT